MQLPLDPTNSDLDPGDLLVELDSETAQRRVLDAADVSFDPDDGHLRDRVAELRPATRRRLANEIRFAGARTLSFREVPDLASVEIDDVSDTDDGAFGSHVRTTVAEGNHSYLVCAVPETGTQAQFGLSADDRQTTVATTGSDSDLLVVRAPDRGTAEATVRTVTDALDVDSGSWLSFDGAFRDRLESSVVEGYSQLTFRVTRDDEDADRAIVRSDADGDDHLDVSDEGITAPLHEYPGAELATGLAALRVDPGLPEDQLRAEVRFDESALTFEQFVPERTLLAVTDTIEECRRTDGR